MEQVAVREQLDPQEQVEQEPLVLLVLKEIQENL
jgi:hypothetical protein